MLEFIFCNLQFYQIQNDVCGNSWYCLDADSTCSACQSLRENFQRTFTNVWYYSIGVRTIARKYSTTLQNRNVLIVIREGVPLKVSRWRFQKLERTGEGLRKFALRRDPAGRLGARRLRRHRRLCVRLVGEARAEKAEDEMVPCRIFWQKQASVSHFAGTLLVRRCAWMMIKVWF